MSEATDNFKNRRKMAWGAWILGGVVWPLVVIIVLFLDPSEQQLELIKAYSVVLYGFVSANLLYYYGSASIEKTAAIKAGATP